MSYKMSEELTSLVPNDTPLHMKEFRETTNDILLELELKRLKECLNQLFDKTLNFDDLKQIYEDIRKSNPSLESIPIKSISEKALLKWMHINKV